MIRKADFQATAVRVTDAIQARMREWRTEFERAGTLNHENPTDNKIELADFARMYLSAGRQKAWIKKTLGLDVLGVGLSRVTLQLTSNWVLKVEYLDADLLGAKHQEEVDGIITPDMEPYDYSQNEREWSRWCASKGKTLRKHLAPISHKGDRWLIMRFVEKSRAKVPTDIEELLFEYCGEDSLAPGNLGRLNGEYVTCDYGWTSNESGEETT